MSIGLVYIPIQNLSTVRFYRISTGSKARAEIVEQVIEKTPAFLRRDRGAPAGHLIDLPVPLSAGQALLADHVLSVAAEAGFPEPGWLSNTTARGWRPCRGRSLLRDLLDHVKADAGNHVPYVSRRIPLLRQRLQIAARIPRSRKNRVIPF